MTGLAATAALAMTFLSALPLAEARVERSSQYRFEQIWATSIRFLRVDEGFEIIERDSEAGYVLFEVAEENKRFRGALELVRVEDGGRPSIRLILRIEDRPTYVEAGVLDRLERKLRDEHGEPPEPAPRSPGKSRDRDKGKKAN